MGYNGIYEYGQSMDDMFTDVKNRVINFEFFREYFDQVSLPVNLAKACVGDMFQPRPRRAAHKEFVKFIRLSTLRRHPRLPRFQDVRRELVDYREIEAFALQGALSLWGGDDVFSDSPCVFVSHRWQSPTHPDPDGAQTATILDRLNQVDEPEVYLWIDYCCLPQRGGRPPSRTDAEQLQIGLRRLPEIVKSCDLMILHSPDYLSRAWCYSELFVWLCKIAEVQFTDNDKKSKLFRSAQTRHLVARGHQSDAHTFDDAVAKNLKFRGFGGSREDLLQMYSPIRSYTHDMADSANYAAGGTPFGGDDEYLPVMINFLCRSWLMLQPMGCTTRADLEICLQVMMDGLKYSRL